VSLAETAALMRELDDLIARCMRCGFCQEVCPVYGQTFREADVARGKIALLRDLGRELIRDAGAVDERLNRCLLCSSCESICPPGVGITEIFLRARAAITAYRGLGPVKRLIFRALLPRPRLFNRLTQVAALYQDIFLKPESPRLGTSSLPVFRPVTGGRHVPSLPREPFSLRKGRILEPAGKSGLKALYFPGCVPDKLFPRLSDASLKVLRRHGVGAVMPEGLACCGIPLAASGDRKGFLRLLDHNLERLALDFDCLVTSCATCASTIRDAWPRYRAYFTGHKRDMLDRLEEKTYDMTSFLVNVLKVDFPDRQAEAQAAAAIPAASRDAADRTAGRGDAAARSAGPGDLGFTAADEARPAAAGEPEGQAAGSGGAPPPAGRAQPPAGAPLRRVTYHDPCHLRRAMKVFEEPRRILRSLSGTVYAEMPEAERCCGNGGSFSLLHYDVSRSIGQRKRDNIVSVSPDIVATSCPACMIQLMDVLSRNGDQADVRHVIELYAESLGEELGEAPGGEAPGLREARDREEAGAGQGVPAS
jgi:glycolate oxidase iron-sulfur subunit